jgi:hypothetical protein
MQPWWDVISTWIIDLPVFWVVFFLAILACLHPLIEFPAGIISFTLLATYWQNVWFAFIFLYAWHVVGLAFVYSLLKKLTPLTKAIQRKFPLTQKAMAWIATQQTWKHILVIGMPLTYTYPLRIGWTIHHTSFKHYIVQASLMYAFFYVGNFLLYFGFIQWVEGFVPLWVLLGGLIALSVIIYLIQPNYSKRLVD